MAMCYLFTRYIRSLDWDPQDSQAVKGDWKARTKTSYNRKIMKNIKKNWKKA